MKKENLCEIKQLFCLESSRIYLELNVSLFLVDRGNLGKQAEDEFANYTPPDDTRKFPTLYTVQWLKSNSINPARRLSSPPFSAFTRC